MRDSSFLSPPIPRPTETFAKPLPPSRGKVGMGVKRASRQVSAHFPPPPGFRLSPDRRSYASDWKSAHAPYPDTPKYDQLFPKSAMPRTPRYGGLQQQVCKHRKINSSPPVHCPLPSSYLPFLSTLSHKLRWVSHRCASTSMASNYPPCSGLAELHTGVCCAIFLL